MKKWKVFIFIILNVLSSCYADPNPDPKPDPMNIILQVNQRVESNQCFPEQEPVPGTSAGKHLDDLETHEVWLHILNQFDRPYHDRFHPRGENKHVYLLENENHIPDRDHSPIIIPAIDHFTTNKHRFKKLLNYRMGRNIYPSWYEEEVRDAYTELYDVYKEHLSAKGVLKVAVNAKDHLNQLMHINGLFHILSSAEASDIKGNGIPPMYDSLPELFTSGCPKPAPVGECCTIGEYPQDLTNEEWKLSYYREDAGYNNYHGSWHFYNPFGLNITWFPTAELEDGIPLSQGEHAYYIHLQILARYDFERLGNGMDRVTPLDDWKQSYIIPENYFPPILTDALSRCDNQSAGILDQMSIARNNLENDIMNNSLQLKNGSWVNIRNNDGIAYVGCALSAAFCGSINHTRYYKLFGIHNMGHAYLAQLGCSDTPSNTTVGVMQGEWRTARDTIFCRWHKYIDNTYQLHKKNLPQHSLSQLVMDGVKGVTVKSIAVHDSTGKEGQLHTFNSNLTLVQWFHYNKSACINQTVTNHLPFAYNITIDYKKEGGEDINVNVRIYMAPAAFSKNYTEQRTLWALMDRFNHTLKNGDTTIIVRPSCNSSLTVPPAKSLQELKEIYGNETLREDFKKSKKTCQCGLPHHLLLPRGTPDGMPFQLFVYITPYNNSQNQHDDCINQECGDLCNRNYAKCFLTDSEPLGFPFDRPLTEVNGTTINTIDDLESMLPNAKLHNITIVYNQTETINWRQCPN